MATKKRVLVLVLTWLVFAVIFFIGAIFVLDGAKYFRLANEGVEAQARVTAKEPDNHFSFDTPTQLMGRNTRE